MYRDLLHDVRPERRQGRRVVYLAEVQLGYDERPLAQLAENHDTARTYHYLTPSNALYGLSAFFFGGARQKDLEHPAWTVARHALVNAFHAGAASRLFPAGDALPHRSSAKSRRTIARQP